MEIPLSQGHVALVDDEDYERILALSPWSILRTPRTLYAKRNGDPTYMHRVIVGAGKGQEVDHRDGDGLNNCRSNLRLASSAENKWNQGPRAGTSQYKGVCWDKTRSNWRANIVVDRRQITLGRYQTQEDAALAYDVAARELHGDYARLNFPERIRNV